MFVGHYAAAMALAAAHPRRGVLTYLSVASALPDILMLGTMPFGGRLNYHADAGLLLCVGIVLLIGAVWRPGWSVVALAFAALLSHLPLDYPYTANDLSNWYAHPWIDFPVESGLVAGAAWLFIRRSRPHRWRIAWTVLAASALIAMQAVWNFPLRHLFWSA